MTQAVFPVGRQHRSGGDEQMGPNLPLRLGQVQRADGSPEGSAVRSSASGRLPTREYISR
jgi:hypothetical protein